MDYKEFKTLTKIKYGEIFSEVIDYFFVNTSAIAINGDTKNALRIAELIKYLMPFTNLDNSEKIYLIGFLGDIYIDNGKLDEAEEAFRIGMQIIRNTNPEEFKFTQSDEEILLEIKVLYENLDLEVESDKEILDNVNKDIIDTFLDLKNRINNAKE